MSRIDRQKQPVQTHRHTCIDTNTCVHMYPPEVWVWFYYWDHSIDCPSFIETENSSWLHERVEPIKYRWTTDFKHMKLNFVLYRTAPLPPAHTHTHLQKLACGSRSQWPRVRAWTSTLSTHSNWPAGSQWAKSSFICHTSLIISCSTEREKNDYNQFATSGSHS